jgi:GrpB-like predicted nucleotidyltransferase (UPF0157 family)
MITQVPYREEWPAEFLRIGHGLRSALGDLALRIDHIGSTAVPGLATKDVIDILITARQLDPAVEEALRGLGYSRIERINSDHIPPGQANEAGSWAKWIFNPPSGQRATNLHVRLAGKPNQRYPILFRDYLRTHPDQERSRPNASGRPRSLLRRERSRLRYYCPSSRSLGGINRLGCRALGLLTDATER